MTKHALFSALTLVAGGCGLIDAASLGLDYSFDPQRYTSPKLGEQASLQAVPELPCGAAVPMDPCAAADALLPADAPTAIRCDPGVSQCVAEAELTLAYPIDLSMQSSFPPEAIRFGVDAVEIKKVAYWIATNTLNVATPPLEIYVAPDAAMDVKDPKAVLLGTVASLPAKSTACADPADPKGDPNAAGASVCTIPLSEPGKAALAAFAKDYKTRFKMIAHAVVVAKAGTPMPTGGIDFYVRPTIGLSILK